MARAARSCSGGADERAGKAKPPGGWTHARAREAGKRTPPRDTARSRVALGSRPRSSDTPESPSSSPRRPSRNHRRSQRKPRKMAANSIIVQCLKCNKVLSDSTALVLSDKERKILGVKGASSIQVHEVRDPTRGTRSRAIETTENLRRSAQIDHSRPFALTPSRSVSTLFRSHRRRP